MQVELLSRARTLLGQHPARAAVLFWLAPAPVAVPLAVATILARDLPGVEFLLAFVAVEWGLLFWLAWRLWRRPSRRLLGILVVITAVVDVYALLHGGIVWWRLLLDVAVVVCCALAWNRPEVAAPANRSLAEPV